MCIIVDNNVASQCLCATPHADFEPIADWLGQNGGLALGGKLSVELAKNSSVNSYIAELLRSGKATLYPPEQVDAEQRRIEKLKLCRSDDPHVIALAAISGARVLCSNDTDLHLDFTNPSLLPKPRGRVYQNATHKHLLRSIPACKAVS